ncbi:bifunctional diaminohydroxyphosphoribosylaminopyrimidine deaminase/5-amino-6-(5-phosphoribosylamino)uracil reductase RibD [Emticicia sp. SJ17W-69]|uniref:bifunctional diaminohydroxyphosphoribosylaminopyrimidine deaminase/5-amino-6-(5-phosphoribosylamino)uracil reductase RibD n=1 Tax=Emticicia sp. SJ17W-69 TaxID=3421657 RepID=UPI003EB8998A
MNTDEKYMLRALQLAEIGRGNVSPNPMVGCVIVHDDKIIGEGWHRKYGDWHAEVNAVNSVKDKSLLSTATVYVTLEPCSHFGKTPPCADLLVKHQVKKVVICNFDPFPLVAGKGIEKLQDAGIEVITGVLEAKGRELNARFFTLIEKKRPYIILKWAETADGFIAGENFEQLKISNALSHKLSHKWRSEEDAMMVGTNTALYDNPRLNVREWIGRNPIRIVVDRNERLPKDLHLFDGSQETIILSNPTQLDELRNNKIQSLIVEGGTKLLQSFIDIQLFDEIRVFKSQNQLKKGISAPILPKNIDLIQKQNLQGDELTIYKNLVSL